MKTLSKYEKVMKVYIGIQETETWGKPEELWFNISVTWILNIRDSLEPLTWCGTVSDIIRPEETLVKNTEYKKHTTV